MDEAMRETSKQAYFLIFPKLGAKQQHCYNYIAQFPDKTDNEYGRISGYGENFRKRRCELVNKGVVEASGTRIVDGREAYTWRCTKR
jgi:hypothetical protein